MREIKFRAWVTDAWESEMIYLGLAGLQKFDYECGYAVSFSVDAYEGFYAHECYEDRIKKYELMQFTGIKDKNGVDIYEGDIVKVYSPTDRKEPFAAEVYYDLNVASFSGKCKDYPVDLFLHNSYKEEDWIPEIWPFLDIARTIEVIGNIYENPELLNNE